LSLTLGMILVETLEPGKAMQLPIPDAAAAASSGVQGTALTLKGFIEHLIPKIVVFSLFFGVAMAALGERGRVVVDVLDSISHIMLKVTGYVMLFAPLAVFGALAGSVAKEGLEIIGVYGIFMGEFYLGLIILWALLITLGGLIIGP